MWARALPASVQLRKAPSGVRSRLAFSFSESCCGDAVDTAVESESRGRASVVQMQRAGPLLAFFYLRPKAPSVQNYERPFRRLQKTGIFSARVCWAGRYFFCRASGAGCSHGSSNAEKPNFNRTARSRFRAAAPTFKSSSFLPVRSRSGTDYYKLASGCSPCGLPSCPSSPPVGGPGLPKFSLGEFAKKTPVPGVRLLRVQSRAL